MVTIRDVVERLPVRVVAGESRLGREVTGGYVGDILSLVLARAGYGNIWVTVQGHPTVVAVAILVGISGIIIADGAHVEPATLEKAEQEGIPLLATSDSSFNVVAKLTALGLNRQEP